MQSSLKQTGSIEMSKRKTSRTRGARHVPAITPRTMCCAIAYCLSPFPLNRNKLRPYKLQLNGAVCQRPRMTNMNGFIGELVIRPAIRPFLRLRCEENDSIPTIDANDELRNCIYNPSAVTLPITFKRSKQQ